jgi:hypothetical protein
MDGDEVAVGHSEGTAEFWQAHNTRVMSRKVQRRETDLAFIFPPLRARKACPDEKNPPCIDAPAGKLFP